LRKLARSIVIRMRMSGWIVGCEDESAAPDLARQRFGEYNGRRRPRELKSAPGRLV
jgi:hypothetical protein